MSSFNISHKKNRKSIKPSTSSKIAKKSLNLDAASMSPPEYDSKDPVDFSDEMNRKVAGIAKKSLNFDAASMSPPENDFKDPVDLSDTMNPKFAGDLMLETDEENLSESLSEAFIFSDRYLADQDLSDRSSSTVITVENDQGLKAEDDDSKLKSTDAEFQVCCLRKAKTQIANLTDVDARSKKLLDKLIEDALKDLHGGLPGEIKRPTRITFCCYLLCVLVVSAISYFSSGNQRAFIGPLPT